MCFTMALRKKASWSEKDWSCHGGALIDQVHPDLVVDVIALVKGAVGGAAQADLVTLDVAAPEDDGFLAGAEPKVVVVLVVVDPGLFQLCELCRDAHGLTVGDLACFRVLADGDDAAVAVRDQQAQPPEDGAFQAVQRGTAEELIQDIVVEIKLVLIHGGTSIWFQIFSHHYTIRRGALQNRF